jgi:hypothetical protein
LICRRQTMPNPVFTGFEPIPKNRSKNPVRGGRISKTGVVTV